MEITLGQQYDVGEKPTVILYIYINRHAGTPENVKTKQRQCSTPSHMVVIIYYYIGYKYKPTTWYLTGFSNGSKKKTQNAPRTSEHPPVRGKNVKTFRWDHRLQIIQNLFRAFKRVPLW